MGIQNFERLRSRMIVSRLFPSNGSNGFPSFSFEDQRADTLL